METETLAMAQEIDFSMLALFARATLTVKLVMLLLIVASFWSWAIIIQKHITYRRARAQADGVRVERARGWQQRSGLLLRLARAAWV